MNKTNLRVIAFGVFFLLFIQMTGTLVESIYILDLMNTSLDENALGVLFFFSPVLLLAFRKKIPGQLVWIVFGLLFLARGMIPYLSTLGRMLASGIGTGAALILFPFLMTAKDKDAAAHHPGLWTSTGLALAVSLSVFLRTVDYSIDYSLTPAGSWVGWGLGLLFGFSINRFAWASEIKVQTRKTRVTPAIVGIFLILALIYFAFSAPGVIARWTEGNYSLIVCAVCLLAVGWTGLSLSNSRLVEKISPIWLLLLNLLFTLSLTGVILAHRVPFPPTSDSPAVVVGVPGWIQQLPLALMLLLFPVIFLDLRVFYDRIQQEKPTPRDMVPGVLLGSLILVLLIFIHIFTNVWGYVEPVSPWFRNKFWLPYLLIAGVITLLTARKGKIAPVPDNDSSAPFHRGWVVFLGVIFIATGIRAIRTERVQPVAVGKPSLVVMTYNIQQANDDFGERSYDQQLALIQKVSPDILALQESDSARISLNNNDYVRYYAGKLGYYSYYGPSTVTGTYGTAILSKYPLQNTRSVFTYSDQDEIGTAEVEIELDGHRFTIYNVHPAGSDTVMLVWAKTLLERSKDKPNVIALGDYNLRDYEEPYRLIAGVYTNAWESTYPSKISDDGVDMSGENRIDHIFVSPSLGISDPIYVLPPDSATDHPVHWAEILWDE